MRTAQNKLPSLTKQERLRLIEVLFFLFINQTLEQHYDYIKLSNFINAAADLFECNREIIQRMALKVLRHDYPFCPRKTETILILYRANAPIHDIISLVGKAKCTIYAIADKEFKDPRTFVPTCTAEEHAQMQRFLRGFSYMRGII